MEQNTSITLGLLFAIIGCFVGLAGWISNRDKKIANDSEFKGAVNAKLDVVLGIKVEVKKIEDDLKEITKKIVVVEESTKSAHKRIDEHITSHD
ncbi:MAG: hypothetical protein RR598_11540 [Anaerorhabdus sp.]|uniref:Uncharacterized protein n=1 Tax=Anaerorhabdus furcosa TaxID=118967 RepID=A0A1T4M2H3_9FIRM|nr:hypothetical protein [Anaerorhabdus furcosa]SJZ61086.1 hypothetical protein SAMN02745191_1151 [Anaerorhabdus furcosa]